MYLLGPLLIALASVIIVGLTYVYFKVILPMIAGSNWVVTHGDWDVYWKERGYDVDSDTTPSTSTEDGQSEFHPADAGADADGSAAQLSTATPILLALTTPLGLLHTAIVSFFLVNVLYNYYKCVVTINTGPQCDSVVRELAVATRFVYPETEEELVRCRKAFERKIFEGVKKRRDAILAARGGNNGGAAVASSSGGGGGGGSAASNAAASTTTPLGTGTPTTAQNGDEESQVASSPLMAATATTTINPSATSLTSNTTKPQPAPPKIHAWQLLSPVEWGYCRYTSKPKPPRSHYDHVTKTLVLNMDHYCPWMFNCVGYFNYRYFFNFLWFVTVGLWYGAAICFPAFMNLGTPAYRDQVRASGGYRKSLRESLKGIVVRHAMSNPYIPTPDERTPVALGFTMCLCLGAAVMCLGGFHLYLVLTAQTTIEFHGNWSKKRKGGWKNPYSAGSWKKNWEMIYGTRGGVVQHKYCGCWGVLMVMMPSSRGPEFLPLPIDGKLVRRRKTNSDARVVADNNSIDGEEVDLEMASSGVTSKNGTELPMATEETEFLMPSRDTNGGLVGRIKTNST